MRRGFTLVEILLYVALFAITVSALSSVYVSSLSTDSLTRRVQELVEAQRSAGTRLREAVQSAGSVTSPANGTSQTLTLAGGGIADGPVTFSVVSGQLTLDTASTAATAITPADVRVDVFTATRLPGSPAGVEITLTLSATSGANVLVETSTFIVIPRYE